MNSESAASLAARLTAVEEALIALAAIIRDAVPGSGERFCKQLDQKYQWAVENARPPEEVAAYQNLLYLARIAGIG